MANIVTHKRPHPITVIMVIGIIPTAMEVKNHSEEERTEQVLFVNSQVLYTVIILFAFIDTCGYHLY